jgi:hypothetical protein
MSTDTVNREKVADIARFLLHVGYLPDGGDDELINIGRYVQTLIPLRPREFTSALVQVLRIAREILRQDRIEQSLAIPAPAPKPRRAQKPRRGGQQRDLFEGGKA